MNFVNYGAVPEADDPLPTPVEDSSRPRRLCSFFALVVLAGAVVTLFLLLEGRGKAGPPAVLPTWTGACLFICNDSVLLAMFTAGLLNGTDGKFWVDRPLLKV